jgi:DNA-binding winged helix-turn-helix (wHTH) protein
MLQDPTLPQPGFPYPLIRAAERARLLECIRCGECAAVIGSSNLGKSVLLRSLCLESSRQQLLDAQDLLPVLVLVDCMKAPNHESAFYELLVRESIVALKSSAIHASVLFALQAQHEAIKAASSDVAIRSLFEECLEIIGRDSHRKFVLLLDELDEAFLGLPPWPFRILRALRDQFEGRFIYITATSRRLERLRSDASLYEFREMFHAHSLMLQPASEADSLLVLDGLRRTHPGINLSEQQETELLKLANGHPGILKRLVLVSPEVALNDNASQRAWITTLESNWAIQQESQRLWEELESEEQEGLLAFSNGGWQVMDSASRQALLEKGLLCQTSDHEGRIFSPLFAAHLSHLRKQFHEIQPQGLYCDLEAGRIFINGTDLTFDLSADQRKLLIYLYRRANGVCTYQEIIDAMWGSGQGILLSAIYELVKRIRQEIEEDFHNPRYLLTVRGVGYTLNPKPE